MTVRHALIGLLVSTLTALTSPAWSQSMEEIRERGVLRVAVYKDFPPYSYRDGARYRGTDVDLARAIAERMGLAMEVRAIGADENMEDDLRNNIWKGHYIGGGVADLMMHVPFDPAFAEENDRAIIFGPYFREQMAIAFDPERLGDATDVTQLAEIRIGVEVDSVGDYYLSGAHGGLLSGAAQRMLTTDEAMDALIDGEVDAVLAPRAQLEGGLAARKADAFRLSMFQLRGMLRSFWDVAIAAKVGNDQLVAEVMSALAALKQDGVLEAVAADYGVSYMAPAADVTAVARP